MHARGPAEDREGAPALRLRLVVAREPRRRPAALGHGLGVARGVELVLEGARANPDRREERAKLVGHDLSLPNTGRLPPPATARLPFECACAGMIEAGIALGERNEKPSKPIPTRRYSQPIR